LAAGRCLFQPLACRHSFDDPGGKRRGHHTDERDATEHDSGRDEAADLGDRGQVSVADGNDCHHCPPRVVGKCEDGRTEAARKSSSLVKIWFILIEGGSDLMSPTCNSEALGASLRTIGITSLILDERAIVKCGIEALAFGYKCGLISSADAVAISVNRLTRGLRLLVTEEEIALSLPDQRQEVEATLEAWTSTRDDGALWYCATFAALVERWQAVDFPELSYRDLLDAWGEPDEWTFPETVKVGQRSRRRLEAWLRFKLQSQSFASASSSVVLPRGFNS